MFEVGAADFKKSELLFRAFRHETLHILVIVFLWNFRKVKTGVPAAGDQGDQGATSSRSRWFPPPEPPQTRTK